MMESEKHTILYSNAKETQKLVTFKLFEYLINSIPKFSLIYYVNRYVMNVKRTWYYHILKSKNFQWFPDLMLDLVD